MLGKYFVIFETWVLRYWGRQALGTLLCVYDTETFADWQGRGSSLSPGTAELKLTWYCMCEPGAV